MGGKEIGASSGEGPSHEIESPLASEGQRAEQQEPSMKHLWLIVALLLACGATAPQGKKKRKCPPCVNGTYHLGSFSILRSHGAPEAAIFALPAMESGKLKRKCPPCVNGTYHLGSFSLLRSHGAPEAAIFNPTEVFALPTVESGKSLETGLNVRSKRESLNLRRGRKRTRPACRGCYSWLSIVAPPGEETHNGTWVAPPRRETRNRTSSESISGSEDRSSEGD